VEVLGESREQRALRSGDGVMRLVARGERSFPMLLPIVAPLTLLAGIVSLTKIVQTDTWVALVAGREVALHGLPSVEHLTVLSQGRRWVDQQWLAQLLLYGVDRVGGVGLVVAVCAAAALGAFALAAAAAQGRGASPLALAFWVPLAFMAGPSGLQARTQSLALLLYGLVLWLIMRDPDLRRRSSLWLLAVLCLWANVHGSVLLGAAVVSVHGLQSLLRTGRRPLPVAVFLLAPATVLVSPYALALPGYYNTMLFHPPYGRQIAEWQRTTPAHAPFFFAVAAVVILALLIRRRRLVPVEWLILAVTFAAALTAIRITPWFALAMLAIVPSLTSRKAATADFARLGATLAAGVMLVAICAGLAWSASRDYNGPRSVIAMLRSAPPTTRVYADLTLADWVIWEAPQLRGMVAYDGRPELMTPREFTDVIRFSRTRPGWRAAVHGYSLIVTNETTAHHVTRSGHGWRSIQTAGGIVLLQRTGRGA
jgi:hypothetical protein